MPKVPEVGGKRCSILGDRAPQVVSCCEKKEQVAAAKLFSKNALIGVRD